MGRLARLERLVDVPSNQISTEEEMDSLNNASQKELKRLVDACERLQEEMKGLAGDIRDKLNEAKSRGFEPRIIRKILALRKKSKEDRDAEEAILSVYMHALEGTPLGDYASRQLEAAE